MSHRVHKHHHSGHQSQVLKGNPGLGCVCLPAVAREWAGLSNGLLAELHSCGSLGLDGLPVGCAYWCLQVKEFQSSTCQCQYQPGRMRSQKWCQPASPFLGRIPVGSCLSGRCFKIGKWISFTFSNRCFSNCLLLFCFVLCCKVCLQTNSLRLDSLCPIALWFSWMYPCLSKPNVLEAYLSCMESEGWDA